MTRALAHRGPDGAGSWCGGPVALGHRRLAIIDLETGQQPLSNEDGQITVTFNGEIYNYRDLRQQLIASGHRFRTQSDTEVLVHGYEQWGDDLPQRLRGMFAFAIVDQRAGRMLLVRDQLGIKPLYYACAGDTFVFASEIAALRASQLLSAAAQQIEPAALDRYLWLQYIPGEQTIFQAVRRLAPAHRLVVDFDGTLHRPERYWSLSAVPSATPRRPAEWCDALDQVIGESVGAHLVADVPFGAFLSGGMDSSAIVAQMARHQSTPVKTFTIAFEESEFDESAAAELVARRWNTEHHVETVRPDALAILPDLARHFGEPFGDFSAVPTYYLARLARQHVPMVLSGDGGDENFAGYRTHRDWAQWLATPDPRSRFRRWLRDLATRIAPHRFPPVAQHRASAENWARFVSWLGYEERVALWRPEFQSLPTRTLESFDSAFRDLASSSAVRCAQRADLLTYLPDDILIKVDIASMMHGLEVRTPLVDVRVVEFAATIPESLLMAPQRDGSWQGKLLLAELLERDYPREHVRRPKQGFGLPVERWFARHGSWRPQLEERLLATDSPLLPFFQPAALRALMARDAVGPLWLLLFLDEWLRQQRALITA